ncbi:MAG: glycosyltransferase family 2 protein [Bacillota bacterium]
MSQKVSAAIITLNEEKNLPRCLESIKWVDEIVIVDSGSTDRTVQIGEEAGARVYHNPWPGYSRQWEKAVQLCSHPWILLIAADNVVEKELADEIQKALASPGDVRGFAFPVKNFFLGKWIKHCGWYPFTSLFLVRKDSCQIAHREVHENFSVYPFIVKQLSGHYEHYTYLSLRQYFEKFNRYTDLQALEMLKNNSPLGEKDLLPAAVHKFFEMYFRQKGYKDGLHGLVLCVLSALYEFVSIAKYAELKGSFEKYGDIS